MEEKLVWERQNAISEGFFPIVVFLTRIHDLKASVTAKVVVCTGLLSLGVPGGAMASPYFGRSVNPISTRRGGQIMPTK